MCTCQVNGEVLLFQKSKTEKGKRKKREKGGLQWRIFLQSDLENAITKHLLLDMHLGISVANYV